MADLAAIKVKIGVRKDGTAKYPAFNALPVVQAYGADWSVYIDREGMGWMYDYIGHDDEDPASPRGQQWGLLLIPEQFAIEAVAQFPGDCTRMTEAECESFYDNQSAVTQPDEIVDVSALEGLERKLRLANEINAPPPTINAIKAEITDALDPDKPNRGVKKNHNSKYAWLKANKGIAFKEPT